MENNTEKNGKRTIWKLSLPEPTPETFKWDLPLPHRILAVQMQGNHICLWALVDPEGEKMTRYFRIFGTGWEMTAADELHNQYLGTVQKGLFVWHVFEEVS